MNIVNAGARYQIESVNNTLILRGLNANINPDWECWDRKMSDEDAEKERENFRKNVRIENVTFTKVNLYMTNKYIDV